VSLSFTDIFCGAGGSSLGLAGAGLELRLAANHWPRAIETHSANFTEADHLCANVNNYDMRRLPRTDVLWASPICTENSPAGGRKRRPKGQLDLLEEAGHVSKDGMERTRATFHDVIRATEVHRYAAVIVENVTEAADWELWDWWLSGMVLLGYNYQLVSVSAAHIGGENNPYAPQWRDRLYIVFTRHGIRLPDVSPKPLAWCPVCETAVEAFQSWKRPDRPRIGKYGRQYVYRCTAATRSLSRSSCPPRRRSTGPTWVPGSGTASGRSRRTRCGGSAPGWSCSRSRSPWRLGATRGSGRDQVTCAPGRSPRCPWGPGLGHRATPSQRRRS